MDEPYVFPHKLERNAEKFANAALSLYWNFLKSPKQANLAFNDQCIPKMGTSPCGVGRSADEGHIYTTLDDFKKSEWTKKILATM